MLLQEDYAPHEPSDLLFPNKPWYQLYPSKRRHKSILNIYFCPRETSRFYEGHASHIIAIKNGLLGPPIIA